jgi:hypothetical protein
MLARRVGMMLVDYSRLRALLRACIFQIRRENGTSWDSISMPLDKAPAQCTMDQLMQKESDLLRLLT